MQTVTEIYQNAAEGFKHNHKDFPFCVLYKIDNEGPNADIIAYAGINQDQTILPSHIDLLKSNSKKQQIFAKPSTKIEIVDSENKGR